MLLAEFRDKNSQRNGEVFKVVSPWSLTDWACAMAGETGEACNEIKKIRRLEGRTDNAAVEERIVRRKKAAIEVADVVIYADLLCEALGYSLEEVLKEKFNEVSAKTGSKIYL